MIQATSAYLNLEPRTLLQAKKEVFAKRFAHYRNFKVRGVLYGDGSLTGSHPLDIEPALDALCDAYGVYGDDEREYPNVPLQYHVNDCETREEAEELASYLNRSI